VFECLLALFFALMTRAVKCDAPRTKMSYRKLVDDALYRACDDLTVYAGFVLDARTAGYVD
jgi:hypothetical protein